MILEQHYLGCLAQASYLIADEGTKKAVVVDPRRDVELYLERARELGLTIEHVLLTHFHADFLSGHLELREATGATIHVGRRGEAAFAFEPMAEGGELVLGDVRLSFLETPGHTPESTSILVFDDGRDAEHPHAVLTGDTLFIGDVGRPDLMSSVGVTAEELAAQLYDSLHEKLLALPDDTIVYPGHGAGSMCGKNLSSDTFATLGNQRQFNYALQPMERDAFVAMITAGQPKAPAYFPYDAKLNKAERATLDTVLARGDRALDLDAFLAEADGGAQVLDTRSAPAFCARHLAGSVNIGLDGSYATWAGTLLDLERPILLVTDPGEERTSALRLGRIGLDRVVGHLAGGIEAAAARPERLASHPRWTTDELAERLAAGDPPLVVDVRTPTEWENGHIEGALHAPLNGFPDGTDAIPRDRELAVICKAGYRSSSAASLLMRAGYSNVVDVIGGMDAWTGTATCTAG